MVNRGVEIKSLCASLKISIRQRNKKLWSKQYKKLQKQFTDLLLEQNDEVFFNEFRTLATTIISRDFVNGNSRAYNYGEIGDQCIPRFTSDLNHEIRWMLCCIQDESALVNKYISVREKIDDAILLNKYEEALKELTIFEKEYGVSFWSIEVRLFLEASLNIDNDDFFSNLPRNVYGSVISYIHFKNREGVTAEEFVEAVNKENDFAKRNNVKNISSFIEFFTYSLLSLTQRFDSDRCLKIIEIMRDCPIIDRYNFVIKALMDNVDIAGAPVAISFGKYAFLLDDIHDNQLTALRFVLDKDNEYREKYDLKTQLDKAKRLFITGNIQSAKDITIEHLKKYPNNTEAVRLLVESIILLDDNTPYFSDTNLGDLIKDLKSIYRLDQLRDKSMLNLSKLAISCSFSSWASSVLADMSYRVLENAEENAHDNIVRNTQHLDIETIFSALKPDEVIKYLHGKPSISDEYVDFILAIFRNDINEATQICKIPLVNDSLCVMDSRLTPLEKISKLPDMNGIGASIAIMSMKYFLENVDLSHYYNDISPILSKMSVDNIYFAMIIPWERLASVIEAEDFNAYGSLYTVILYYIYANYVNEDKKEEFAFIIDEFLAENQAMFPSDLFEKLDKYCYELIVFFYREVCTVGTMRRTIYQFKTSQDCDRERISICKYLIKIDSENIKEYENEIHMISQELSLSAELRKIEDDKIQVNTEGIKKRLLDDGEKDFQRYSFFREERFSQLRSVFEDNSLTNVYKMSYTPERILKEMITTIRDAFVLSPEYGLDTHLSINIRHGIIDDELNGPNVGNRLVVKKDDEGNEYIYDEYWTRYETPNDHMILQNAFGLFYNNFFGTIHKLKEDYLQICTEERLNNGLFKYALSDGDFIELSTLLSEVKEYDELFDIVVKYMWSITERNLREVKKIISTEISSEFYDAYNQLKESLSGMQNTTRMSEIRHAADEAQNDMHNVIRKVLYWFELPIGGDYNDFNLDFAFNMALQTIKELHPDLYFNVNKLNAEGGELISGRYLRYFDDIFYNLLKNVSENAKVVKGNINIDILLSNKDGKINIYMENDTDESSDVEERNSKIQRAKELINSNQYLGKVRKEGGTGIPKICKIIKYDIQANAPYIDFGFINDSNRFYIKIETEGII